MPRRRKDIAFEESLFNNMDDYMIFRSRLLDIACGSFNFENVPENVYLPYVIDKLIYKGEVLAFKDDILDEFYIYDYTTAGKLSPYNIPLKRHVTLANVGASYYLDETNSVILRANVSRTSLIHVIEYFARNMYLINRTIQININAQKTPVVILCDDNQRLTYENILKQYQGNVPAIFGSKDLDLSNIKALQLNSPLVAPQLYTLLANYWNEFLTFFGIPNVSMNKKERLISDEVERSLGGVIVAKQNFVNQIQRDIDSINKMFGLDIKFTWGASDETTVNEDIFDYNEVNATIDEEKGGEE